ncbi:hypothetical protein GT755_11405 [Herbidospora sp. NEAU-GS84]|uniref:Uncharacterized protein n=1 Tax=Herbidospora solisilvae TaxID=2696284 RepID=A0A7C9J875_9ACTN|nr:DUF6461 domain-containing protein [Herbidospora solisilvae]NAS22288.1 hypothetical protein [Herbidospora solisilvae]
MITAADYAWQRDWEEIYTVTFVKGADEDEVLRRFGVTEPGEVTWDDVYERYEERDGENDLVVVARTGDWMIALHMWGWEAAENVFLEKMSRGGEAVSVMRHDYAASHYFGHAVDGSVRTSFPPNRPGERDGAAPDALLDDMRDLGLDPEPKGSGSVASALALASCITGVLFTPGLFQDPLYGGTFGA